MCQYPSKLAKDSVPIYIHATKSKAFFKSTYNGNISWIIEHGILHFLSTLNIDKKFKIIWRCAVKNLSAKPSPLEASSLEIIHVLINHLVGFWKYKEYIPIYLKWMNDLRNTFIKPMQVWVRLGLGRDRPRKMYHDDSNNHLVWRVGSTVKWQNCMRRSLIIY